MTITDKYRESLLTAQTIMGGLERYDLARDLASILAWFDNPPRLAITQEGGMIQAVVSDRPQDVHLASVTIIDYDHDGVDDEDLCFVPQPDDEDADAIVREESIMLAAIDLDGIRPKIEPDDEPGLVPVSLLDEIDKVIDCNAMRTEADAIARQIEGGQ